jgi:hypothetical protein
MKSTLKILGKLWLPKITAALDVDLSPKEVKELPLVSDITREDVEKLVDKHGRDFSEIIDFSAFIVKETESSEKIVPEKDGIRILAVVIGVPFFSGENEEAYLDCMYEGYNED